jgi:hypothetical protein
MPSVDDLTVTIDLEGVQRSADRVRGMLLDLRSRHDLSPFEYARKVRIAPLEIPHSHPVITLNSFWRDELGLLATYLHEQMHWYVTWYSHIDCGRWRQLFRLLRERYQQVPVGGSEGAPDEFSGYLHLIVNWLEVEITARFVERDRVVDHVLALHFYRWMYRTVVDDWQALAALYRDYGLVPVKPATDMSAEDLRIAALVDEAPSL